MRSLGFKVPPWVHQTKKIAAPQIKRVRSQSACVFPSWFGARRRRQADTVAFRHGVHQGVEAGEQYQGGGGGIRSDEWQAKWQWHGRWRGVGLKTDDDDFGLHAPELRPQGEVVPCP